MINNRQNGRRRGRGGQRPGGGNPGRPESGNRIDSRARGNAGQLLEKYKALAADAQRQGDRVNTEYYLQFADHYFRVLAESRPRSDEQQQPQRRGVDAFEDEFDADGADDFGQEGEAGTPDQFQPRGDDRFQQGRPDTRRDERPRQDRQGQERQGQDRPERQGQERPQEARRDARPRFDEARDQGGRDQTGRDQGGRSMDGRRDVNRGERPRTNGAERTVDAAAERLDAIVMGAPAGDEVLTAPAPGTQEASTPRAADMASTPIPGGDAGEAPAPRRRGRPPRVRVEADDAAPTGFDAERLPPSLSVSASAEPDSGEAGEPLEKPRRRRRIAAPVEAGSAS